jgi:glycosyltransferase involved in cell wall biosynthesis
MAEREGFGFSGEHLARPRLRRLVRPLEHIGINAAFLRPRMGGIGTYVRRLVPEMAALRPDLDFTVYVGPSGLPVLSGAGLEEAGVRVRAHRRLDVPLARAAAEMTLLGPLARRDGADLVHSVAMTGPLGRALPHVVTIPDVTWMRQPESVDRLTGWTWRTFVPRVARRADRVIALSQHGADDVVAYLGVRPELVDVIPLGADLEPRARPAEEAELRARLDLGPGPLVLAVAANRPNKNPARLIEAMPDVERAVPGAVLVMAGAPGSQDAELRALVERLGVTARFPGHVDDSDLEGLYAAAGCLALPSLHEGFGLPILEAMSRGLPVVCADTSVLPEVAGDAAAYFDPRDPRDIARALAEVLSDHALAARLAAAGRERARGFSWPAAAEATIASYERAWAARGGAPA